MKICVDYLKTNTSYVEVTKRISDDSPRSDVAKSAKELPRSDVTKLTKKLPESYVTKPLKKYKCSFCNYESDWKDSLKRHLIVHSSNKFYRCLECSYTSKWKISL